MQFGKSSDKRILGFDGLRAIAFVLVFISHKYPTHSTEAMGTSGVWLFFVLSGFLITRNLAGQRARAADVRFWAL
jgi:peptidoglycan/LPS O-acetylase OafA/YrhL